MTFEPMSTEVLTSVVEHSMKSLFLESGERLRRPVVGLVKASRTCGPLGSIVIMISYFISQIPPSSQTGHVRLFLQLL